MGLPNLPSPSEGIFCCLLGNVVFPVFIFKAIVRILLHIFGIHFSSSSLTSPDTSQYPPELFEFPESFEFLDSPSGCSYINELKSKTPTHRFDSVSCSKQGEVECIVCLTQFEPESEINYLSCGHIFHKVCLEKWLNYWNITCPLCRAPLKIQGAKQSHYLLLSQCNTKIVLGTIHRTNLYLYFIHTQQQHHHLHHHPLQNHFSVQPFLLNFF
ncbi:hypothetical protein RIF29_17075 [Crotalaria pallida]|uniref:RING-type domain-containing protein n=1 Tax=Crotalaria pallida TaxID=3830 RepID=A0AAN9ICL9_CROPI